MIGLAFSAGFFCNKIRREFDGADIILLGVIDYTLLLWRKFIQLVCQSRNNVSQCFTGFGLVADF